MNTNPVAEFHIIKNGPLKVTGNFKITSTNGTRMDTGNEAYLCRCGGSSNKPFCDGTHKKNGFQG